MPGWLAAERFLQLRTERKKNDIDGRYSTNETPAPGPEMSQQQQPFRSETTAIQ